MENKLISPAHSDFEMCNDICNPAKCEIRNLLIFLNAEIVLWNPSFTVSVANNECQSITICLNRTLRLTNFYNHIEESEGCSQFWREPKINEQRLMWKCKKVDMNAPIFIFICERKFTLQMYIPAFLLWKLLWVCRSQKWELNQEFFAVNLCLWIIMHYF